MIVQKVDFEFGNIRLRVRWPKKSGFRKCSYVRRQTTEPISTIMYTNHVAYFGSTYGCKISFYKGWRTNPLHLTQRTKEKFNIVYKIKRVDGCGWRVVVIICFMHPYFWNVC